MAAPDSGEIILSRRNHHGRQAMSTSTSRRSVASSLKSIENAERLGEGGSVQVRSCNGVEQGLARGSEIVGTRRLGVRLHTHWIEDESGRRGARFNEPFVLQPLKHIIQRGEVS